jgi:hypothetical protein
MNTSLSLLTLTLVLLISVPAFAVGIIFGRRNPRPPSHDAPPPPNLEVIEVLESGNILWRYGPGPTLVTGYCHRNQYPDQALQKIADHLNTAHHTQAADLLLEDFFNSRRD